MSRLKRWRVALFVALLTTVVGGVAVYRNIVRKHDPVRAQSSEGPVRVHRTDGEIVFDFRGTIDPRFFHVFDLTFNTDGRLLTVGNPVATVVSRLWPL